ncbi:MAG TPA: hypothetical protein VMB91_13045 [Solirubrobacteraceae bacterium]|nr:hypothetical protein [Solirubrobacteraceae bacterium]
MPGEHPERDQQDQTGAVDSRGVQRDPDQLRPQVTETPVGDGRDPRAKEPALRRLHAASDEVLAVFEQNLRDDASAAGASEQEIRAAQAEHPEHP